MQKHIENLMNRCSSITDDFLTNAIKDLPVQMQEVMKVINKYGKTVEKGNTLHQKMDFGMYSFEHKKSQSVFTR